MPPVSILNVRINKPKILSARVSLPSQSGIKYATYSSEATTNNASVDTSITRFIEYVSGASAQNPVANAAVSPLPTEIVYSCEVATSSLGVSTSGIDRVSSYRSESGINNLIVSSNVLDRDSTAPKLVQGQTWNAEVRNITYIGFQFVLDYQASDDQAPQQSLKYGLIVAEGGADYVNKLDAAKLDPINFSEFEDVKTGRELDQNGNRLSFNDGKNTDDQGQVIAYYVTAVVWDDYGNSSSYDPILGVTLPELVISDLSFIRQELFLDVNEEVTPDYTYDGVGITGEVTWESLDPTTVEHLGGGRFKAIKSGQTAIRIRSVDDPTVTDISTVYVEDYQTIVQGEVSSFDVGADDETPVVYSSQATLNNLSVSSNQFAIQAVVYSSDATTSGLSLSSSQYIRTGQNMSVEQYQSGVLDDEALVAYSEPNVISTEYQSEATTSDLQLTSFVYEQFSEVVYTSNATTDSLGITSEVGEFVPFVEGEDNAFLTEYTPSGKLENEALVKYDDSVLQVEYLSDVTTSNVLVESANSLIDLVISTSYSSEATQSFQSVNTNLFDQVVSVQYQKGVSASNAAINVNLEFINPIIYKQYSGWATSDNLKLNNVIKFNRIKNTIYASDATTDNATMNATLQ